MKIKRDLLQELLESAHRNDSINIKNHDFKSGEKVKYTSGSSTIGGLD